MKASQIALARLLEAASREGGGALEQAGWLLERGVTVTGMHVAGEADLSGAGNE